MKHYRQEFLADAWVEWSGGVVIEQRFAGGDWQQMVCSTPELPEFHKKCEYRIKPDCEYALFKVEQAGGRSLLRSYSHWISGGKMDYMQGGSASLFSLSDDPFMHFINADKCGTFRVREDVVKKTLWVYKKLITSEDGFVFRPEVWLKEGEDMSIVLEKSGYGSTLKSEWYKVSGLSIAVGV